MADFPGSLQDLSAGSDGFAETTGSNRMGDVIDHAPPVLNAITPMQGLLVAPKAPVQFTVSKATGFASVIVEASYRGSNTRELIWDSAHGFNGYYLGAANMCVITSQAGQPIAYAFTILRDGGWPADLDITIFATDTFGNSLHP